MMEKQNRVIELDDTRTGTATTEEFLAQIHRSTALMSENRTEEAKQTLEEAFQSRQNDPLSQATLGLVYFKLGIYPRAVTIYQQLINSYPNEATLRLNLGLVYLKTGQIDSAVKELETAVRLSPDYRKANGYLGLAYQRYGDYYGAKRAFEKAGAHQLAERMDQYLPIENDISNSSGAPNSHHPTFDASCISEDEAHKLSVDLAGFIEELPFLSTPPPDTDHAKNFSVSLQELAANASVKTPGQKTFWTTESGYLMMTVSDRCYTRLAGLHFLSADQIVYKPLHQRFRGKQSDELFGSKKDPMFEIKGSGQLAFHPGDGIFYAIDLDVASLFLIENHLFAAEPSLMYENGRIPVDGGSVVNLSGQGALVLNTPRAINSVEVTPQNGAIIPADHLVGWFGRLLPRPATQTPFAPELSVIELTGEGVVLFCLP